MDAIKVLIVDDEAAVLRSVTRALRKESYIIEATSSPLEALECVRKQTYAVVLSDHMMPEMRGTDLLRQVRKVSPDTVRIILTGHADSHTLEQAVNEGEIYRFLAKPWDDGHMRRLIRQSVEQHGLSRENRRLQTLTEQQNQELQRANATLEARVQERTAHIEALNADLRESFVGALKGMASLVDAHSRVIGSHSRRVASLARDLARRLGLAEADVFDTFAAAVLHDVGKIGADDHGGAGLEQAAEHAVRGETIVGRVAGLRAAARLVRHHHENVDGSGGPDGQQHEQIPLGARIIAVANAYDNALNGADTFEDADAAAVLEQLNSLVEKSLDRRVLGELKVLLAETGQLSRDQHQAEVGPEDLQAGMRLLREVRTVSGRLLLAAGTTIQSQQLASFRRFQATDPVVEAILVTRRRHSGKA